MNCVFAESVAACITTIYGMLECSAYKIYGKSGTGWHMGVPL